MFTFYPATLKRYESWTYFEECFTPDECKKILDFSKTVEPVVPVFPNEDGEEVINTAYKNSVIRTLQWGNETDWMYHRLFEKISYVNDIIWQFELNGIFEGLDIIEYSTGGSMDWHADGLAATTSTRKLSMSIQLSDPSEYEGGELELFVGHISNAPKKLGLITIFPSYIYHQVTEVTSGSRTTMVAHSHGRPYK